MKKSLIALAALAAVSAASAQSSVTLYGLVDIGYGSQTTKSRDGTSTNLSTRGVMDGANAGNRIGFRGVEDLGGGLKAEFVIETGIAPTANNSFAVRAGAAGHQVSGFGSSVPAAGTGLSGLSGTGGSFSAATNRQSYLGLSSAGMGTLRIGYQYTNMYELATLSGYAVGSEGLPGGDKAHLSNNSFAVGGTRANGITYISPNFSGFTVRAQYGTSFSNPEVLTSNGVDSGSRRMGLMGQYANGPLSVALAYTTMRSSGPVLITAGLPAAQVNTAKRTGNMTQLGASYDFGVAKLAGSYLTSKDGGVPGSLTINNKFRAYQIGVSAPFGAFTPFLMYGNSKTTENSTATVVEDFRSVQAGVRYSLSKRTTAYAMFGRTNNSATSPVAATNNAILTSDRKSIVGIAHSF